MGLKRLFKKGLMGGGDIVRGHIADAIYRKKKTGRPFKECLQETIRETITEDMPISSHVYQMGRRNGRIQGTAEQAATDERKFRDLHEKHEADKRKWREQDKMKDDLIDEMAKNIND